MNLQDIQPKQDDAQRLLALNGVPKAFWLSAEEINLILDVLARLLGNESALYKGEHQDLQYLNAAHPLPEPGSYAQIIVVNGDNLKASWDNTDKKWFLDGLYVEPGSDAAYLLKSVHDADGDGVIDKAKHIHSVLTAGGTKYYGTQNGVPGVYSFPNLEGGSSTAVNKINVKSAGYQGGLNYKPYGDWNFGATNFVKTVDPPLQLAAADPTYTRIDLIVYNSAGNIIIKQGTPAANPVEPTTDPNTELVAFLIIIPAGATEPEGVSLTKIWDENTGNPGEWVASIGSGTWQFGDTSGPHTGAVAIKGVDLAQYDRLNFIPPAAVPVANFTEVTLMIKNITSQPISPFYLVVTGETGETRGAKTRTLNLGNLGQYGYDPVNTADWQFIAVPVSALSIINIQRLEISVNYMFTSSVLVTSLFDLIQYNDGSAPTGENFATVGYVDRKTRETLDAANAYADSLLSGGTAPVAYSTMSALYAAQGDQVANGNYRVDDASAHPNVNAGRAWFDYKGTTVGDHTDYILKSEEESLNLDAQLSAIENRLTALEAQEEFTSAEKSKLEVLKLEGVILVSASRLLDLSDHKQKLCIEDPGITLTYPAAGLGEGFEFNAATNASGTLQISVEAGGAAIDGLTYLPEGSMGHVFKWPAGALTTKGDWE